MAEIENVAACARHRVEHSLGRVLDLPPARQQPARIEVALNRAERQRRSRRQIVGKINLQRDQRVLTGQRLSGMVRAGGTGSPEHPGAPRIRPVTAASGPADQSTCARASREPAQLSNTITASAPAAIWAMR